MMLTITVPKPGLVRFSHDRTRCSQKFDRATSVWAMKMESKLSHNRIEELSVELPKQPSLPHLDSSRDRPLQFNRGQPSNKDLDPEDMFEFGGYIARQAMCDEEYWTSAYVRAATRWEDRNNDKYVQSHIKKYTEQEFNEIKRRSKIQYGYKCRCIVTMTKDSKDVKRNVLQSMVGTLDLRTRYMMDGETFPEQLVKHSEFKDFKMTRENRYGYIANLCVIKRARRQGVGSNMLQFAIKQAKLDELERVYMHVDRKNNEAMGLYKKMGFQIVEGASAELEKDQLYLLYLKV